MASLPAGQILLYGGWNNSGSSYGDTWRWIGSRWEEHTATGGVPAARYDHPMTSLASGEVLLFGGHFGSSYLNDTWLYAP